MEFISKNEKDTLHFGNDLKEDASSNTVFLLKGDLGAGKTTFVKGIIKALGGALNDVSSPTYVYAQEYQLANLKVYHLDLYRIVKGGFDSELVDFLENLSGPILIEWPENISDKLLMQIKRVYKVIEVHFEIGSFNMRKITTRRCQN